MDPGLVCRTYGTCLDLRHDHPFLTANNAIPILESYSPTHQNRRRSPTAFPLAILSGIQNSR